MTIKTKTYLRTIFFFAGALSMLIMSMHYFQEEITGILKGKNISSSLWYRLCLKTHIVFGIVAMLIGPFQFIKKIRTNYSKWHRRIGYVYFLSVIISSVTGLLVAQFALGGIISRIGFSFLAILWFVITLLALKSILKRNIKLHKKYMFISYALTFAAIPQRTMLLFPLFFSIDFIPVYRLSAWLPWILNTFLALYFYKKSMNKNYNNLA